MTTTQAPTITVTVRNAERTFTVRRDSDAIVLVNSKGEDTGYIFPEFKNVGAFVVGACARRWTSAECRTVAAEALAAVGVA